MSEAATRRRPRLDTEILAPSSIPPNYSPASRPGDTEARFSYRSAERSVDESQIAELYESGSAHMATERLLPISCFLPREEVTKQPRWRPLAITRFLGSLASYARPQESVTTRADAARPNLTEIFRFCSSYHQPTSACSSGSANPGVVGGELHHNTRYEPAADHEYSERPTARADGPQNSCRYQPGSEGCAAEYGRGASEPVTTYCERIPT
jgi:hypothetical protein